MSFAVIMAGGRGERLWPLSTPEKPKQFLKLGGESTMLQETIVRISPLIPKENVYTVTPKEFVTLTTEQLAACGVPTENVIAEPGGRNTAACVGLAAIMLEEKEEVMVILPADHVIKNQESFLTILQRAIDLAKTEDFLITLGIVPSHPATGYGYINRGDLFAKMDGIEIYEVQNFTEKPDVKTAKQFLKEGNYYWNSGIFIWRVEAILAEIEQHMPQLYTGLLEIKKHLGKPNLDEAIMQVYEKQESISIDYGIMERSANVKMIPAEIGWNDVGDWAALDRLFDKDQDGNVVRAMHMGIDTKNSIIFALHSSDEKIIATIGLENVVIVDTDTMILVIDKSRAQEVRELVKMAGKEIE